MKKNYNADKDQVTFSRTGKTVLSAAYTLSICGGIAAVIAISLVALGLCSDSALLYVVIGILAAFIGLLAVTMISSIKKLLNAERNQSDSIAKRIHGIAAGDHEAIEEDAYDYDPVDSSVCSALSAALAEIDARGARAKSLADKYVETSEERDDYQFRMLGAQMIPGMIERAIRKIGRTAEQRKINDIAAFSNSLCDLMDSSLQASKKPTSLASELALIRTYLDLDDAITGRRTEYRMSVMCSIVGYKLVPHLILPVVENLLEHSERSKTAKYELAIEITSEPENMAVIIRDNGRGIDVDTLERIQRCLDTNSIDSDDDPLSLPSINRRIVLCYGDRYGLKVSSSKMGTSVRLTLPSKPDPIYNID